MSGNDQAARTYWAQQMDAAAEFMARAAAFAVHECGEPLVSLREAVDAADIDIVFSETKVIENIDRLFYLREGLIEPFVAAAREMNESGWVMKVEDGFRTRAIQKGLARRPDVFDAVMRTVLWETGGAVPDAQFMQKRVLALIAYCPKVGTHLSGSAIDISVIDVDRGGPYVEMSHRTPMDSPFILQPAQRNRRAITELMSRHGFVHYPYEFWHYNQGDAYDHILNGCSAPARYGPVDWDPRTNRVTPIENPTEPLNSLEEIEHSIHASLNRLRVA